ncbi:MAG: glutamate synthase large subunit [Oligoflexus sp.]|nr:glutamate synthase large subunit [Oligoflexus sp.]
MDVKNFNARKSCLDDPRDVQRDACGVGFIAHLKGQASHQIVMDGLEILKRLDHRGGRAADGITSDGAGIQMHIPRSFLQAESLKAGIELPKVYALGMIFLPKAETEKDEWLDRIAILAAERQYRLIWKRPVPVDSTILGPIAKASEPSIYQLIFLDQAPKQADANWRLYLLRKDVEREAADRYGLKQHDLYVVSLSTETVCYKGLVRADDFADYFLDLKDPEFKSAVSLVHQRFSTNTLPAWPLAQPFRMLCHNGEINTLRGNISAMNARTALLSSDSHKDLELVAPICVPGFSDSAMLDNTLEFLLHSGRSLPEAITMLVPEPWEQNSEMPTDLREYYEYQSYRMEPWDGPAFIGFTDGRTVGAILDRNGLRPGRYWVTCDEHVIMASEAGVLDRRPEEIVLKGRLSPGRIFMVDMVAGEIIPDHDIKADLAAQQNYGQWLKEHRFELEEGEMLEDEHSEKRRLQLMRAFGYSQEDMRLLLAPMANEGKEPVGSMGTDVPIAVLSNQRPLLYEYFKQLFAQVTNPPIDAIREELVTSLSTSLGSETNLFRRSEKPVIRLSHPVLLKSEMMALYKQKKLKLATLDLRFELQTPLGDALTELTEKASAAVRSGAEILVLSDRGLDEKTAAIPALLACSAVHHSLIREGLRARASLVVSSGEPREVHHFALLFSYGASAVHPYLALELIEGADEKSSLASIDPWKRAKNYRKAVEGGILKIMSKMGISTLQSYRGAQIFEALGLTQAFVDQYFPWTTTRIEGVSLDDFAEDLLIRHQVAFASSATILNDPGVYTWRRNGERHLHEPDMIANLQKATRINSREEFKKFCEQLDRGQINLRSLLTFKTGTTPIPLDEVEAVSSIVRRFATGAMSFGSISKETHETVAIAMNRIGAKSNSGEGGEDAARFHKLSNGDSKRSAIKQVASARFGVTNHYLVNADELQIKMAQGAKPGEGGQLPGDKVDSEIARVRHSMPGITLISPPPHHDIYSIEDLAQLIFDLKNANHKARVSVKLVSEVGVGTIAAGVAKAKADAILISGYEGGTGASPLSSIRHAGLPWELGLSETQRALVDNQLRGRVTLQVDGQLRTARDLAIATMMGAEEWGIGTGALIVLGCIMMRKCHLNTCPVGIATQDPVLRERFVGQPEHLINYIFLLAEGLREIMAELGLRTVQEMVGRVDLLEKKSFPAGTRMDRINVDALLNPPKGQGARYKVENQEHHILESLDARDFRPASQRAFDGKSNVVINRNLINTDRTVGTFLSSEISRQFGAQGMLSHSIHLNFKGIGGQSFMAFAVQGLKVRLEGEVNDYCAKGLSGAQVAIFHSSSMQGEQQVICGNVALYGATAGTLYVRGSAGERFAVRNSGAHTVVEGLGDHGCEYMTGGSVIVIGPIGRNFGAGMSGGLAFVYDKNRNAQKHINTEMLSLSRGIEPEDESLIWEQLEEHLRLTGSPNARRILERWSQERDNFLSIVPSAYRAIRKTVAVNKPQRMSRELETGGLHG